MKLEDAKFHFVGVGGIGMSALAELLHMMGAKVSGSDLGKGKQTDYLEKLGITIFIGQKAENVKDVDVVVCSSAIKRDNPEMLTAREKKIPIIPRAEALAEIMRYKRGIAVGGTHGKTTTTSIISSIFMNSDMDPTIAVGGRLKLIESTARLGKGPWMVAEADESDGSFFRYSPEICIITNIDNDHMDYYGTFENLQKAFLGFALNIPFYGKAIVFGDDPKTRELFNEFSKKIIFYGTGENNDFVLSEKGDTYSVSHEGELIGEFNLQVPGVHNALNALAAVIATHFAGVPWEKCFEGANMYSGVDRRFQPIGKTQGVEVFDDYAHHPTEILATLTGARKKYKDHKIHAVYQPHRYTRTRDCWEAYKTCFPSIDHLYLVDIYPAGEEPIDKISSKELSGVIEKTQVSYSGNFETAVAQIKKNLGDKDIVLTMGAGNVWQCAQKLIDSINGQ